MIRGMEVLSESGGLLTAFSLSRNLSVQLPPPSTPLGSMEAAMHADALHFNVSLAVMLAWMGVVAASTLWPASFFPTLSLKASVRELAEARQSRLAVLDVFRVLAIVWVMANHLGSEGRVDVLERRPSAQGFKDAVHNHPVFGALLGNSALGVEVFLVLSGLLAARSWRRNADQPFVRHAVGFLVRRVLRLLPIVAAFMFVAAGPVLKRALPRFHASMVSQCGARGLAAHLTLTGNWQPTPTCLGYLWYVGLDTQLYLLAPPLLQLARRRPRLALWTGAALALASAALRAWRCRAHAVCNRSDVDIPFIAFPGQDAAAVRRVYAGLWEMYGRPCTKCGPFLVGLALGVAGERLSLAPRPARRLLLAASALALLVVYAILPEYWYPDQGDTLYNTLYTATFRTVFALAVASQIAALVHGAHQVQVAPFWAVLAKLTFNAYLLHMPTVYLFNHVQLLQDATSAYVLVLLLPVLCVLSFAFAFVFYCFVEGPFARISAQFLKLYVL